MFTQIIVMHALMESEVSGAANVKAGPVQRIGYCVERRYGENGKLEKLNSMESLADNPMGLDFIF